MTLENLSNIGTNQWEWQSRKTPVYRKLKFFFFLHEVFHHSKLIILFIMGILLQQPLVIGWIHKLLWQMQFLTQNIFSWVIP